MFTFITAIGLLLTSWLPFAPVTKSVTPAQRSHSVCAEPTSGLGSCLAKVYGHSDGSVAPAAATGELPAGLSPSQLRSAYKIPLTTGGHVAVIGAYDNPTIKTDLDNYSQTFGLPILPKCSYRVTTSCFGKYDQQGGNSNPFRNRGWSLETALDVQTIHAVCPSCRIDLVESRSATISNLMTAVDTGVSLGASVVSMSWGTGEFSSQTAYDSHFASPGVTFVSAAGDSGYGAEWPAASGHVLSVGGTTLTLSSSGDRTSEKVWSSTGSGCSAYESKPVWQSDAGCSRRTIADISADADPATGAAIYSSYTPYGSGWFQIGGTSLSAPIIAGLTTQAASTSQAQVLRSLYNAIGKSSLYDVTSGSNGACTPAYLCTSGQGYDGPSGVGTPNGPSAF